ncbi:MAG: glycosyltransferase family 2 protein [Phycisphaerae bacterium]|nr:glycosyltransferase family 2 protein [Phycisphaerae bacterium]
MKISAVIPAYNSEKTIGRAIDSVLKQMRPADEILVVDDGSTDNTAEITRTFGEKVILIQQENAGVSVARNAGIDAATGDWIAFLDADDEWLENKLQLQAEHLERHPGLKWTYSNFYRKDPAREQLQPAHVSPKLTELLAAESFDDYLQAYSNGDYAWTSTLVIHRKVFKKVGLFEPGMKRAQDNDLWYRIGYQFPKVGYLSEPLAIYHLDTPGSSTKTNDSVDFMMDLVHRHEALSKQANRYEAFCPCIVLMLQLWIRQLLEMKRQKDAILLMNYFRDYLPDRFCREIRFRIYIPVAGSMIADAVLFVKRKRLK